jgi:hypothetical protein
MILTVRKIGWTIPISKEQFESGMWARWMWQGTCGIRHLDTKFAAEYAELSDPWRRWESEGGAL